MVAAVLGRVGRGGLADGPEQCVTGAVGLKVRLPVCCGMGQRVQGGQSQAGHRALSYTDWRRSRLGVMPYRALGAIDTGTPQVVQVRTGEVRQPLKPPLAKDLELPPHHRTGGRATHRVSDLVNLGQQTDIGRRVDPLEGPPAIALTAVGDLPRLPVLGNEPGHLGAGQSRFLARYLRTAPLSDRLSPS